ncbi:Endoplasmic reticulum lectin 1 [Nymphon striatum]|nr:Endoplasmic reticulum lectin 1 [Nymphon striatum]
MNMKFEATLHILQLFFLITFLCLSTPVKSSEVVLNEYGTVFDVIDFDKKNVFDIQWPGQQTKFESSSYTENDYESVPVIMKTARNEKYACYIPNNRVSEQEAGSSEDPNPYTLLATAFKASQVSPCSYRLESYWTYEVCHGRYVRQYHENKENSAKPQLQEYLLGKFDEESFSKAEKEYETNKDQFNPAVKRIEGNDFPYIEINMTDGTLCDLNKNPRKTRVKYICYPEGLNHLYSFQETVTCEYEIVILSPILCKHSVFRQKKTSESKIKCYSDPNTSKKPKDLTLLELQSAEERLLSAKSNLKIIGLGLNEHDENNQKASDTDNKVVSEDIEVDEKKRKVTVNIKLKNIPPENPPTEIRHVRPPPLPQDDQNLKKDFLSGSFCLEGGGSWWKYRFCFQKRVEQFHKDMSTKKFTTILLGIWNGEQAKTLDKSGVYTSKYINGDICDTTGKPREVLVRLKCLRKANSFNFVSMALYEPKTCQYILTVESPILCSLTDDDVSKPSS